MTRQRLVPGVIGFAPATDAVYLRELQAAAGPQAVGLVNRLRSLYTTLDTDRFFALDADGQGADARALVAEAASALHAGGADFLVVTSNTGSMIAETAGIDVPMLDIFAETIAEVARSGAKRVGLLSTQRTLDSRRYQLAGAADGIDVLAPPQAIVAAIDALIGREAIRGVQTPASLALLQSAAADLAGRGADVVVLGCTDLVLFGPEHIGRGSIPVIDSTTVHARAAARRALTGA